MRETSNRKRMIFSGKYYHRTYVRISSPPIGHAKTRQDSISPGGYNRVGESGFKSFNTIAATFYGHSDEILNFYDNRSTNASAETINSKIKAFRSKLQVAMTLNFSSSDSAIGLHKHRFITMCHFSGRALTPHHRQDIPLRHRHQP